MKPIKFKEVNVNYAANQDEYHTLPAMRTSEGVVTFCMQLDADELEEVQRTGVIWHTVLTFNAPLQPQLMQTRPPEGITVTDPDQYDIFETDETDIADNDLYAKGDDIYIHGRRSSIGTWRMHSEGAVFHYAQGFEYESLSVSQVIQLTDTGNAFTERSNAEEADQ